MRCRAITKSDTKDWRLGKRCKFAAHVGVLCYRHAKLTTRYPVRITP